MMFLTKNVILVAILVIMAPHGVMASSCKAWLNKVFDTTKYREAKLEQLRDVSGSPTPEATFYERLGAYKDPFTQTPYFLPGQKTKKLLFFKKQPLVSFHLLRQDHFTSERLAIYQNRVVVLKVFDHPEVWEGHLHTFKSRFYTEIDSLEYLKQNLQLKVVDVIDHSFEDRIIIKEFLPGYPFGKINRESQKLAINEMTIAGLGLDHFINELQYFKINEGYEKLHSRINWLNAKDRRFKVWARQKHVVPYIDISMPQTTLCWNGQWYINSPYALY